MRPIPLIIAILFCAAQWSVVTVAFSGMSPAEAQDVLSELASSVSGGGGTEASDAAADAPDAAAAEGDISADSDPGADAAIAARISAIFAEIDSLTAVQVRVDAGVVTLSGEVPDPAAATRAETIASRISGVVTVENELTRNVRVKDNVAPVMDRLIARAEELVRLAPLLVIAVVIVGLFWLLGSLVARFRALWDRITPNAFLAELLATTAKLVLILIGLVTAFDLLGATTLIGAILGSAGVIGLAIGFAVKDTVDNYVSSIMLSIRQPFRANDHVVIGDREGRVIRLTSRATILMTLDGNHLRIPNSTVFMAEILNFTTNPERRFDFVLGVDANDDPAAAMKAGLERMRAMPFVLDDPAPTARLEEVGDSNIVLRFLGWIDQRETDWFKARSAAIRAVKIVLEDAGFGLPEPIYRLRFDPGSPLEIARGGQGTGAPAKAAAPASPAADEDVAADSAIAEKVEEERQKGGERDMLDGSRPTE
jgi:small conductance mechanosensitive channel